MSNEISKQRYLDILSTGVFASFSPQQLDELHSEVKLFLGVSSDQLDNVELFDLYELQFYLSLLTNHDIEAKSYLDRFNDQFMGQQSQKLMILRSMYYEATGDLKSAVGALGDSTDELRTSRRLATFSRYKSDGNPNTAEYAKNLTLFLDLQPSDVLAWAELGDLYTSMGHYDKAVFCFKEILLHHPDAYNMFYKSGLALYYQLLALMKKSDKKDSLLEAKGIFEHARACFLRSVEINESYVKGWLGVYALESSQFLEKLTANKSIAQSAEGRQLLADSDKLLKLSRLRIMAIERLATEEDFSKFIKA